MFACLECYLNTTRDSTQRCIALVVCTNLSHARVKTLTGREERNVISRTEDADRLKIQLAGPGFRKRVAQCDIVE